MKNWKNLSKRGLALLVCLMMCLSMMPGVAFAKDYPSSVDDYCGICVSRTRFELISKVEPTCQSEGAKEHYQCTRCGTKYHHDRNTPYTSLEWLLKIDRVPCDYSIPATCQKAATCKWCGKEDPNGQKDPANHTGSANDEWETVGDQHVRYYSCCPDVVAQSHAPNWSDATCTAPKTCTTCGLTEGTKLNHTFTNYVSDNNASCTADGTKTATCDVCHDATDTITDMGTKLDHDFNTDEWERNGEEHWHQCKNCDAKQDAADHVFDPWEIFEGNVPTAVAPGRVKHTCTVCDYLETKLIGSLNSDNWEATQTKDPTCTESGTKTYTWIGGGEYEVDDEAVSFEEEIPALGHEMTKTEAKAATCEEAGNNEYWTCSVCEKVFKDEEGETETTVEAETLAKLNHDWNDWVVNPAPTKDTAGEATRTCKHAGCNKVETTTLPKLGEGNTEWEYKVTKAPGCETAGEATYTYKADGRVAGPVVIPALGHDVSTDWTQGDETHYHKCSRCEHTEDSQPHSYKWEITTESTKDAGGVATGTCSVCGKEVTKDIAPLDPDNLNAEWEFTSHKTLPSCTGTGIDVYTHKETGDSQEVIVDALGHDFSTGWTTDGVNHWHACSRCEARDSYSVHTSNGGVVTVAPTYDSTGLRTHTCTACGVVWTETIPALTTTPTLPVPDGTGGTGGTGTGDTGDNGTTVIDDQDVPLASIIFEDVLPSDWFYDAVNYVYNRGLMQGVSETRFDPYGTLTRAMVVTILYRLEGEPEAEPSAFKDVEAGQWYTDAIGWASANEVVEGYDDERFGPMDPVTREQLAAILYRYAQYKGYDVTETADLAAYTDASSIHEYAVEAMGWAVALGAPTPLSENTLSPRENATRAQVAEAFMNFCEKYVPLETEGEAE